MLVKEAAGVWRRIASSGSRELRLPTNPNVMHIIALWTFRFQCLLLLYQQLIIEYLANIPTQYNDFSTIRLPAVVQTVFPSKFFIGFRKYQCLLLPILCQIEFTFPWMAIIYFSSLCQQAAMLGRYILPPICYIGNTTRESEWTANFHRRV